MFIVDGKGRPPSVRRAMSIVDGDGSYGIFNKQRDIDDHPSPIQTWPSWRRATNRRIPFYKHGPKPDGGRPTVAFLSINMALLTEGLCDTTVGRNPLRYLTRR